MKHLRVVILLVFGLFSQQAFSQIHFDTLTRAYDESGEKIGVHFISANISQGVGILTVEDTKMQATVVNTTRNETYGITGYALSLAAPKGKKVDAAIRKYDDGRYTVVINFADGEVRYDIDRPPVKLEDFTKTQTHKVTYDESFIPTLILSFKNVSDKVITSVEIAVSYDKGLDRWDWRYPTRSYVVQSRIKPGETNTIKLTVPKEIEGRKPGHFSINRIRFEDGSICDR